MAHALHTYFEQLKGQGLSADRERRMQEELTDTRTHELTEETAEFPISTAYPLCAYAYHDLLFIQDFSPPRGASSAYLKSLDELLERDRLREKDGFPRKIRVGRLVKPTRSGKEKIVVVPTTVEEKFLHDNRFRPPDEDTASGGSGEGEEGEVVGEQPVRPEGEGETEGPGEGSAGPHEMESSAYELGKILTEKFELPNLQDKGKKRSLTRFTYDLSDRHKGFGQLLDKKATLRKILETNTHLGNVPDISHIDPTGFLISPSDMIYRILSREKDYESQAMVFFLRDYSGSMEGKPTELVVAQHVLIYSWLLYQYENQVESRFILHDVEAKEVKDFYTYYNFKVAGGTKVASAFKLVNEIVEQESLVRDYNIYVFHGTDGDDWDTGGNETLPEIKKMLTYVNRIGISIVQHATTQTRKSEVQTYLTHSGLLDSHKRLIRLDVMSTEADEPRLIEGIKRLIRE